MNTRQLYYLLTISDAGSISAAAQILGISQPALSKFLSDYEASVGYLLFLRCHKQLTPTSVGRYVLDYAQKILDAQTTMLQTLRSVSDEHHAHIRLATAPNRAAIIYSRIYNQFAARYPDVTLTLTELYATDQANAIQHGQVDLAIGSGIFSYKVTDIPIAYEELLVSLPISHPMAMAGSIRLNDLRDTPFVLQGQRHSIRILADKLFKDAGFEPLIAFESNDVLLVDSMLHQGLGAGLVSKAHVFPCEELVYRRLEPPIHQTLHIRYPLGHTLSSAEKYLAGLLIRERLSDSRYTKIPSLESDALLDSLLETDINASAAESNAPGVKNKDILQNLSGRTAPEINLNLQILQYIISIADEKSLCRAAEKYYLPQPALSRHLKNIEKMLCVSLFTRVHNRLQPTNAGKIFINFARNILKNEAEMEVHIHAYAKGHGGTLCICCVPFLKSWLENEISAEFAKTHPDVKLRISAGTREEQQEALLNASADFGIFFTCEKKLPVLAYEPVFETELRYCYGNPVPAKLSSCTHTQPDILHRKMMLADRSMDLRTEQLRILQKLSHIVPETVCEADPGILRLLAAQSAADVILPEYMLTEAALKRSCSFKPAEIFRLVLAFHPGRTLSSSARDLASLILSAARIQNKVYLPGFDN